MATTATVPEVAAAPAASTTPSTPTTSPSSAPAAASPTAPAAQPSTPATPTAPAGPRDEQGALRDAISKLPIFQEPAPTEKPVVTAPVVEEAKPEEVAKPAEEVKPAAAVPVEEANPLDKLGPLPVEALAKAIQESPALSQALEQAGLDPELLYETSRRAALGDQLIEAGATTPEVVKFMSESANHFYDIEEQFPKIQNVNDFEGFVEKVMLPLSIVRGPDGQPLLNPDGSYQTDGSMARYFDAHNQYETVQAVRAADRWVNAFSSLSGEEGERLQADAKRVREALILSQEFRDNGYRMPGAKAESGAVPPETQAELDRLRARERDVNARDTQARETALTNFETQTSTDIIDRAAPFVSETLNRTSLNDNEKRFIAKQVMEDAAELMAKDRSYQSRKAALWNQGQNDDIRKQLVTLGVETFRIYAKKAMEREIQTAGAKQITASKERQSKIDTQQANDKMNQGTGTTPRAAAPQVLTGAAARSQAIANWKAKAENRGMEPNDGDILNETLALKNLRPTA